MYDKIGIAELARNILQYAELGILEFEAVCRRRPRPRPVKGLEVRAVDSGPGIANVNMAMMFGYSTSGGLGMGLPGVKSLMDEVEVQTGIGQGTIITARKWVDVPKLAE